MPPSTPTAAAALDFLGRGWSPIPCCPPDHARCSARHREGCNKPGKAPLVSWAPYQLKPPTRAQVEAWWQMWPQANVGITCGQASRLVGIDVDGEPGEDLLATWAEGRELPETLRFLTGKPQSYRLLYALPEDHPCPPWPMETPDGAVPLTVLGDGSQTIMPPSVHESGAEYRWAANYGPDEFPLAPAPGWMLDKLARRARDEATGRVKSQVLGDGEPIPEGGRDSALTVIAGAVRRWGCTEHEIRALLDEVNNRCDPPVSKADINRISRSVARYAPSDVPGNRALAEMTRPAAGALVVSMQDVEPEPTAWLWPGWIPGGMLACLDGDGGVGKSGVTIDLAARVTRGWPMPDGSRPTAFTGPQNVLLVCCEDALAQTIRPRADAAGADVSRVRYLEEVHDPYTAEVRQLELPLDIPAVEQVVRDHQIKFCVIDPVLAFMGGENDASRDQDVRRTVGPLKRIAQQYGCTFLYVRHWNKGSQGGQASYRGSGSLAWSNLARSQLICGHTPDPDRWGPGCGELHNPKNNLAPRQGGWVYQVAPGPDGATRITWLGRSDRTADEIANAGPDLPAGSRADPDALAAEAQAAEWLRGRLLDGPAPVRELTQEARLLGFTESQVRKARERLRVQVLRDPGTPGPSPRYLWQLPAQRPEETPRDEESGEEAF